MGPIVTFTANATNVANPVTVVGYHTVTEGGADAHRLIFPGMPTSVTINLTDEALAEWKANFTQFRTGQIITING